MKHFEDLWEEAEKIVIEYSKLDGVDFAPLDRLQELIDMLPSYDDDRSEERNQCLGEILLNLCFFTKLYDINAYASLANAAQDLNIERLEVMDGD